MYKCKLLIGRCEYQFGGNKCAAETPCENRGLSFPDDRLTVEEKKSARDIKRKIANIYLINSDLLEIDSCFLPENTGELKK